MREANQEADRRARQSASRTYSAFGIDLVSDFPFESPMAPALGQPEVKFTAATGYEAACSWAALEPQYASTTRLESGESAVYVYRAPDCVIVRFSGVVIFRLTDTRITYELLDPDYGFMVEIHFLGFVVSLFLELRGVAALHASAVVVGDRAIAVLAGGKGGKSSLAASLMLRGMPLLTDDVLAIEWRDDAYWARSSYPQMRMWPSEARWFLGHATLSRAHPRFSKLRVPVGSDGFGTFHAEAAPLECIYVPQRRDGGDVEIVTMSPSEAMFALLRQSFLAHVFHEMADAKDLKQKRLDGFAKLVQTVTFKRLVYPDGYECLTDTIHAIEHDVGRQSLSAAGEGL